MTKTIPSGGFRPSKTRASHSRSCFQSSVQVENELMCKGQKLPEIYCVSFDLCFQEEKSRLVVLLGLVLGVTSYTNGWFSRHMDA